MALRNILHEYSQTIGERSKIDDIMTIALLVQRIFGHQILDPKWTWKNFIHYQIFTLFLTIYVFLGTVQIIRNTTEAELLAEASYTLLLIVSCPIKAVLFIQNRKTFRELYLTAKTVLFQVIQGKFEARIANVLSQANKAVYALLAMVVVPVMLYELRAIWNYCSGARILLSRTTATLLPLTSPYFEISWFLHSIFMVEMSCIIIVTDMWYVFLMYFLCLASDGLKEILVVKERSRGEDKSSYEERLNNSLKIFYEAHIPQVQYIMQLSSMYKWLALVPLINAAFCICMVLLVVSKGVNLAFASHMLPLFGEVLAYSCLGELFRSKAQDIRMTLINFDWGNLRPKDKTNYLILMTYWKKDFGVKTAIGNNLCLVTMTKVLKGSYQIFTVLNTID